MRVTDIQMAKLPPFLFQINSTGNNRRALDIFSKLPSVTQLDAKAGKDCGYPPNQSSE
jgi:hypothetical protein